MRRFGTPASKHRGTPTPPASPRTRRGRAFFVVISGHAIGVTNNWLEASLATSGAAGSIQQGFDTWDSALAHWEAFGPQDFHSGENVFSGDRGNGEPAYYRGTPLLSLTPHMGPYTPAVNPETMTPAPFAALTPPPALAPSAVLTPPPALTPSPPPMPGSMPPLVTPTAPGSSATHRRLYPLLPAHDIDFNPPPPPPPSYCAPDRSTSDILRVSPRSPASEPYPFVTPSLRHTAVSRPQGPSANLQTPSVAGSTGVPADHARMPLSPRSHGSHSSSNLDLHIASHPAAVGQHNDYEVRVRMMGWQEEQAPSAFDSPNRRSEARDSQFQSPTRNSPMTRNHPTPATVPAAPQPASPRPAAPRPAARRPAARRPAARRPAAPHGRPMPATMPTAPQPATPRSPSPIWIDPSVSSWIATNAGIQQRSHATSPSTLGSVSSVSTLSTMAFAGGSNVAPAEVNGAPGETEVAPGETEEEHIRRLETAPLGDMFFAIANGRLEGVYEGPWSNVQQYVSAYRGALFRGFYERGLADDCLHGLVSLRTGGSQNIPHLTIPRYKCAPSCENFLTIELRPMVPDTQERLGLAGKCKGRDALNKSRLKDYQNRYNNIKRVGRRKVSKVKRQDREKVLRDDDVVKFNEQYAYATHIVYKSCEKDPLLTPFMQEQERALWRRCQVIENDLRADGDDDCNWIPKYIQALESLKAEVLQHALSVVERGVENLETGSAAIHGQRCLVSAVHQEIELHRQGVHAVAGDEMNPGEGPGNVDRNGGSEQPTAGPRGSGSEEETQDRDRAPNKPPRTPRVLPSSCVSLPLPLSPL
ncbi:hypothetical protein FA95DRAFT_1660089, partial [Auriscalpium vulgare]